MKRHLYHLSLASLFLFLASCLPAGKACLLSPRPSFALTPLPTTTPDYEYVINSFDNTIEINQDTSLTITEELLVNFNVPKHGIFRIIPLTYSANGKTINAGFKILSITDSNNKPYLYTTSRYNQSLKIQIGDPNKTITGRAIYVVKYRINDVLLRYKDHDEVYWNAIGPEHDADIKSAKVDIKSDFAQIKKIICYAGTFGSKEQHCPASSNGKTGQAFVKSDLAQNQAFTVVVALEKNNNLHFPNAIQRTQKNIFDNWGYLLALGPLGILFFVWYKKGRDLKYLSDNVYTIPEGQKTTTVPLFAREHLPMVYSPINNVSPSQVGTIIDEKVDTKDVVAEIVELARLGFLEIKRTEEKKFLGKKIEYTFTKKSKDQSKLKDYQVFLFDKLFETGPVVKLSDLKENFYQHLEAYKDKLYKNLDKEKIFSGNPKSARMLWGLLYAVMMIVSFPFVITFTAMSANPGPMLLFLPGIIPAIILIKNMPRRTAWGHSLYRQIVGLKYFINEGKWREEIAEKNLFFEEILPLAICLGLVHKLAKDMQELGIRPPDYLNGFVVANLASNLDHFSAHAASNLVSSPAGTSWSGHSSWSGGSGFSGGGSSGGGFGGGGTGSW